ncbi:MAG TPA: hypothetical protein ENG68_00005, partial [bacterium]|nr:hypothetical protein [bacterium]
NLNWLPFKTKIEKKRFWRVDIKNKEKPLLLEGLGNSDFFWKEVRELPVIVNPADERISPAVFSQVKYGKGCFIFLEVAPDNFKNSRAYAKTIRILSSIFTNLGIPINFHLFEGKELDFTNERWDFKTDPENIGMKEGWWKKEFDSSGWKKLRVAYKKGLTGGWELQGITEFNPDFPGNEGSSYNGFAWYRYKFFLPEEYKGKKLYLKIGAIDGSDWVYINGKEIGKTLDADKDNGKYLWDRARDYLIPEDVLYFGSENVIAIRVLDEVGEGGITKKPVRIELSPEYPTLTLLYPMVKPFSNYDPMRFRQW